MDANTSNETESNGGIKDAKRQQFTSKQRMDMYAFCVLELEMHSNKVSIKKQQQAIQKVLDKQQEESLKSEPNQTDSSQANLQLQLQQPKPHPTPLTATTTMITAAPQHHQDQLPTQPQEQQQPSTLPQQEQPIEQNGNGQEEPQQNDTSCNLSGVEGKTLLQLQQEVAMTRKCYSDYQRTQVLTSSMLRDVQKRFAQYYPDSAIPSRTTIKHVFEKCVAHGTVENMRTPRKVTKIPQGDEIEYLLIHEPQLSLRQMAQKLNVSTGTVSRRCKALGLVPESVTIKHQQLATARRQKQIKQLESQTKIEPTNTINNNHTNATADNNSNNNINNNNIVIIDNINQTTTPTSNGTHGAELPKYLSK